MSATLTMKVEGHRLPLELEGVLTEKLPQVKSAIVYKSYEINKKVVPRKSGNLQDSFGYNADNPLSLAFFWEVWYAEYVDKGVPPSPGRYVPAIGKRLVGFRREIVNVPGMADTGNFLQQTGKAHVFDKPAFQAYEKAKHSLYRSEKIVHTKYVGHAQEMWHVQGHKISPKRQMAQRARDLGMPQEVQDLMMHTRTRRIQDEISSPGALGQFFQAMTDEYQTYMRDIERRRMKVIRKAQKMLGEEYNPWFLENNPRLPEKMRNELKRFNVEAQRLNDAVYIGGHFRKPGKIEVAMLSETSPRATERHELQHQMDWVTGKVFTGYDKPWAERPHEISAVTGEKQGKFQHGPIGMHPGFKGRHYSTKFMMELRTMAVQETVKILHEALSG